MAGDEVLGRLHRGGRLREPLLPGAEPLRSCSNGARRGNRRAPSGAAAAPGAQTATQASGISGCASAPGHTASSYCTPTSKGMSSM